MTPSNKINKSDSTRHITNIVEQLHSILEKAQKIPRFDDGSFVDYRQICQSIPHQIKSGGLKVAVIGVIKSGKSTFINSFVKKEVVKRGAGVMTAITTRIQKGKKNNALLYFKSWDDINLQLRSALECFPDEGESDTTGVDIQQFDIRRKKDRLFLKTVHESIMTDISIGGEEIRIEQQYMSHALNGFNACKDLVGADETCHEFSSKKFNTHKKFTANPDHAFYMKDVCLELYGNALDSNLEIADCQGADSTDPSQLSKVLNYIENANLIVYCISSRTGLRQSDMVLLNRIKRIGLLDQLIFINNCDLSEHENLEDLQRIENTILKELSALNIQPRLFSFSTLYNLFSSQASGLKSKDFARLSFWQNDQDMIQYCDQQTHDFQHFFTKLMDKNHHSLLISNHLNRLKIINQQLSFRADIFQDLLSLDSKKENQALAKLQNFYSNASRLEAIVLNSLEGTARELKKEIKSEILHYFKSDSADILKNTRQFMGKTDLKVDAYKSIVKKSGFKKILYLMFQDFKQQLDLYSLEQVMPEIKIYIKKQEKVITSYFHSLLEAYQIDFLESDKILNNESFKKQLKAYQEKTGQEKTESDGIDQDAIGLVDLDMEKIKKVMGLKLPNHVFIAKYSSSIKANVFSNFFLKMVSEISGVLLKKKSDFSFSPVLEKTATTIKKESQKVLKVQFIQFGETLLSAYFSPLIEACIREFKDKIDQQFKQYRSFEQQTKGVFSMSAIQKQDQQKIVIEIKDQIEKMDHQISNLNQTVNQVVHKRQ